MTFTFGKYNTNIFFRQEIPTIENLASDLLLDTNSQSFKPLIIADENTFFIADKIRNDQNFPICIIKSGEENKNWQSAETILSAAFNAGLARDGIFIAVGGGVIGDLTGFASSIYMRGCRLIIVSTTLLGMVDASVGGKTGFDIFGIKNLAGTFYPAENVYIPFDALSTLPEKEIKSGMAELIKTAILSDNLSMIEELLSNNKTTLNKCIEMAVLYKSGIVQEDPLESGKRMLLNLGHTFGHALESAARFGTITHGEAVAWGIHQACRLGCGLGITPVSRAQQIINLLSSFGYETTCPHPLVSDTDALLTAMNSDKKKKQGKLTFIVPDENSARIVSIESDDEIKILKNILNGKE